MWVGQLRDEFYNKAEYKAGNFAPGAAVIIGPELTGEHDPNAIVVHNATDHRAEIFNKQIARAIKRATDNGATLNSISVRGTPAGMACEDVAVLAAAPEALALLISPRPDALPAPARLRSRGAHQWHPARPPPRVAIRRPPRALGLASPCRC